MVTVKVDRAIIFPSPQGDRPFGSPSLPPKAGASSVRPEPCRAISGAGGCQSFRKAAGFGARHHKEAGPAMEPAK